MNRTLVSPASVDASQLNIARQPLSRAVILFSFICLYVVIPVLDIPILGVSLSAPLFFLIILEVYVRPAEPWLRQYRLWVGIALWIWISIFLSGALNGLLSGGVDFDVNGLLTIIRYAYWLLFFVTTVYLVSRARMGSHLLRLMAFALVGTALLRWSEALFLGKIGAWTDTQFMTQNGYGWLFSTFSPFLLVPLIGGMGNRVGWTLANLLVWGAAAVNGSRGSWISIIAGVLTFLLLYLAASPRQIVRLSWLAVLLMVFMGLMVAAPQKIVGGISTRFATLQKLDEDKSFMIRQLMIQKGIRLFQESPIIGIGAGRWTKESVPLDIPFRLSYASQSHFDRRSSHNSYVSFLAENGLLGTIPYALLLIVILSKGAWASIQLARNKMFYGLGFYAGFVGMSIHLWAMSGLTNTATWLVYGLVGAVIFVQSSDHLLRKSN